MTRVVIAEENAQGELYDCALCGESFRAESNGRKQRWCEDCGRRFYADPSQTQACFEAQARTHKATLLARQALSERMTLVQFCRLTDQQRRNLEYRADVKEASEPTYVTATVLLQEILIRYSVPREQRLSSTKEDK